MRMWLYAAAGLGAALVWSARGDDSPATTARATLEQWVETRQVIAATRADSERQREVLEQTKALHLRELAGLEETLRGISTNSVTATDERERAARDLESADAAIQRLEARLPELESKVRSLLPLFPAPLLEAVRPMVDRLPTNAAPVAARSNERLQAVVAILNEADKFQNSITVANSRQADAGGQELNVDVLYLGLSGAYFADPQGRIAGSGRPTPSGWVWTRDEAVGPTVRAAIAMYRNSRQAAFVSLPFRIE